MSLFTHGNYAILLRLLFVLLLTPSKSNTVSEQKMNFSRHLHMIFPHNDSAPEDNENSVLGKKSQPEWQQQ